jgi:hypothetical protein
LLRQRATGALIAVATTHMPTPGGGGGGGGDGAEDGPRSAQQVQFSEALVVEVAAMLDALGVADRVPVLLCGDWNSKPGKPAHTLLTTGGLPADTPALNLTAASLEQRRRADEAEDAYAARMAAARARPIALPYPAPSCGGGGAFVSAYAAAAGGAEPPFTTSRRIRSEAPRAADAPADAPAVYVEQPLFTDTLDYIFARQPQPLPAVAAAAAAAAALPGPPRAELQLVAVGALPTDASREGAMPSKDQPSDHAPLTATYRVVIAST